MVSSVDGGVSEGQWGGDYGLDEGSGVGGMAGLGHDGVESEILYC